LARYRLRFLLQEFDLPPGETIIGRGPDCRITLVDPLVSRHHARVTIEGSQAILEDLGSRNGSRVNARQLRGPHVLSDGDRIRIGTQELIFSEVASVHLAGRQTGFLCHCADCKMPYPEELKTCPNCGSARIDEEDTLSGILDDRGRQNWALQMLIDMLRKAVLLGRENDADRVMHKAVATVEERMHAPLEVDPDQLEALAVESLRLSAMIDDVKWAKWSLDTYRRSARVPPLSVAEALSKLSSSQQLTLAPELQRLLQAIAGHQLNDDEAARLARFKMIEARLQEATP
jgi:hypothetical protein